MTVGEFKAFIDGMGVESAPTGEQWRRIVEKLEALEASSTTPQIPKTVEPPLFLCEPIRYTPLATMMVTESTTTNGETQ